MHADRRCPPEDTLSQFRQGELSDAQQRWVQRHLQACAACREAMAEERRLDELLSAFSVSGPPAGLADRIMAAAPGPKTITPVACREARRMMDVVVDGEGTPEQEERLWAHMFGCAACLRRYRETEALVRIPRTSPVAAAPAWLPQRILAALAAPQVAPRRLAWKGAPTAAALAAVAVLVAAISLGLRAPQTAPVPVETPPPSVVSTAPTTPEAAPRIAELPRDLPPASTVTRPDRRGEGTRLAYRAPASRPPGLRTPSPAPAMPIPPASPTRPDVSGPAPTPAAVLPVPVYSTPPAPAPRPSAPSALLPAPVPAPPSVMSLAEAPRTLGTPPPAPGVTGVAPTRPVVVSTPPQDTRPLRLTPSQPASVVVIHRQPEEHDSALADAGQALTRYGQELKRSQPRQLIVAK